MKNIKNFDEYLFEAESSAAAGPTPTPKISLPDTLKTPSNQLVFQGDGTTLKVGKDPQNLYNYKVEGQYGDSWYSPVFDVRMKGLTKDKDGNIKGQVTPTGIKGSAILATMKLIPKVKASMQGDWLNITIPKDKLEAGLAALRKTGGKTGQIDATPKGETTKIFVNLSLV